MDGKPRLMNEHRIFPAWTQEHSICGKMEPGTNGLSSSEDNYWLRKFSVLLFSINLVGIPIHLNKKSPHLLLKIWRVVVVFLVALFCVNKVIVTYGTTKHPGSAMTQGIMHLTQACTVVSWVVSRFRLTRHKPFACFRQIITTEINSETCHKSSEMKLKVGISLLTICTWVAAFMDSGHMLFAPFFDAPVMDRYSFVLQSVSKENSKTFLQVFHIIHKIHTFTYRFIIVNGVWFTIILYSIMCVKIASSYKDMANCLPKLTVSQLSSFRQIFISTTEDVDTFNNSLSISVLTWYTLLLFYLCSRAYEWILVTTQNAVTVSTSFAIVCVLFVVLSEMAGSVQREAQELCNQIVRQLPEKLDLYDDNLKWVKWSYLITTLTNTEVGLTGGNAFIISRGFTVSLVGSVFSVMVIVLQMNPEVKNKLGI